MIFHFQVGLREIIEDANQLKKWIKGNFIPLLPNLLIETKKGKVSHCEILSKNLLRLS